MIARQKAALLGRRVVDHEFDGVGADAAIIEKNIALGRRAESGDAGARRSFPGDQRAKVVADAFDPSLESLVPVEAVEAKRLFLGDDPGDGRFDRAPAFAPSPPR